MDIRHFYLEEGEGEPLLLLHGNGECIGYFEKQIGYFAQYFHVYALDTRGHGQTPRGIMPFTIKQFAKDLYGFMQEHKLERAHILGFSDGGNIAMQFAYDHPECVNRLILNGANLTPIGLRAYARIPIRIGYDLCRFFRPIFPAIRMLKKQEELLGLMVNEPDFPTADLKQITAPTLVIAGTNDMVEEFETREIYEGLPNAKLCILEGDHFISTKRAERFNRIVLRFLTEHSVL